MSETVAIVVTYNRLELLKLCLEKLNKQTVACDILVVDNNSTDQTSIWLKQYLPSHPHVLYRNTGENLGGAGGFHHGIRWAIEAGYSFLWLMDDDCLPQPNALEALHNADTALLGNYGWLSSVALWTDGTECRMNRQKLKKAHHNSILCEKEEWLPANQATFVSLFLRANTVRQVGNVLAPYYIWGDDVEYTRRIAVRQTMPSFVVTQSKVVHAMRENNGSSIAFDSIERLPRYRLAFRNESHLYRQEGIRGSLYYLAKCILNLCRILFLAPNHRLQRACVLLTGMADGFRFHPQIEMFL